MEKIMRIKNTNLAQKKGRQCWLKKKNARVLQGFLHGIKDTVTSG